MKRWQAWDFGRTNINWAAALLITIQHILWFVLSGNQISIISIYLIYRLLFGILVVFVVSITLLRRRRLTSWNPLSVPFFIHLTHWSILMKTVVGILEVGLWFNCSLFPQIYYRGEAMHSQTTFWKMEQCRLSSKSIGCYIK